METINLAIAYFDGETETSWESGRKAAIAQLVLADNPEGPDTRAHAEWNSGFVFGNRVNVSQASNEVREAGWMAALNGAEPSTNPYMYDEPEYRVWNTGWCLGHALMDEAGAAEPLPLIEVKTIPERSFWAVLNNLQINLCLSKAEMAAKAGISVELLEDRMTFFGFYDEDAIPMNELVVVAA